VAAAAAVAALVGATAGAGSGSLVAAVAVGTGLFAGAMVVIEGERRRLHRTISQPVAAAADQAAALGRGESLAVEPLAALGPPEVRSLLRALQTLDDRVGALGSLLRRRDRALSDLEADLQLLLGLSQDIGGSTNVAFVVRGAADAAAAVTGAERMRVWLREGNLLSACYDSAAEDVFAPGAAPIELGAGSVGAAAAGGCIVVGDDHPELERPRSSSSRPARGGQVLAVPLTAGSRVLGVIELGDADALDLAPQQRWVLELVASTTGAVLQAARLEHHAELRSRVDPATGLGNYRQFVADLAVEVHRAARYHRPLSLVVLDVGGAGSAPGEPSRTGRMEDRLVVAASVATAVSRACDSVYRFGPAELAVLVRESDERAATTYAERLVSRISDAELAQLGPGRVRAGVAAVELDATQGAVDAAAGGELLRRASVALQAAGSAPFASDRSAPPAPAGPGAAVVPWSAVAVDPADATGAGAGTEGTPARDPDQLRSVVKRPTMTG
jgi:GGDEF domain-containing protein